MFGYVLPCKPELKIKDYEKFKAYYCGLCVSIKNQFGQIPRLGLNYDMTFLAILIDSLTNNERELVKSHCIIHPIKKKLKIINNDSINYAAFCNVALAYYKSLDDVNDNNSLTAKIFCSFLKKYIDRDENYKYLNTIIHDNLNKLNKYENNPSSLTLDEICEPFANLTGEILSFYYKETNFEESLYWLGYNLGKWIYIIDAWDDLSEDMNKQKFNGLDAILNKKNLSYENFSKSIEKRVDNLLTICAYNCYSSLKKLPLKRNEELLQNILQLGLLEKTDKVFKRSDLDNERSI